ncbi:MAG: amidohydrolase family protein [Candidatus Tectomicrobia bacterium]|uniref:Amidohydrolase family protein n=1 Tax=Tectimicrobiota bacterium TaxID=2528274 RepID=A0A932ZVA2_UNCTE|nr:amidohydrolase family protein [Candidatus Tectomicrobia bacterium]MBI2131321.1 amidohydrolase family protein [Candidatus Tectomicrobia bacterium]MBI2176805.1 amidohydrolase family protein [Candidatus Tectomicrobia bacterium]MBI4252236.1 amidohydrolase family protein [Candidatus Tectomicrobia bacterium]
MAKCVMALVVAGLLLSGAAKGAGAAYEGPMISTHSQYDDDIEIDEVVRILKEARISKVLLSTRLKRPKEEILEAAREHPGLVVPLARTKVRPYIRGAPGWSDYLENIKASKIFAGMQELLLYHAAKINPRGVQTAPEIVVRASEERVAQAIAAAGARGWPVTLHYEFRYLGNQGDPRRKQFFDEMEALLRKHRDRAFTLMHMAQLGREEAEALIRAHPNVYFQLSMAANVYRPMMPEPWTYMFAEGGGLGELEPGWKKILETHPERFLLAFDGVFAGLWRRAVVWDAQEWRAALGTLRERAARLIAHENAERLWPALRH